MPLTAFRSSGGLFSVAAYAMRHDQRIQRPPFFSRPRLVGLSWGLRWLAVAIGCVVVFPSTCCAAIMALCARTYAEITPGPMMNGYMAYDHGDAAQAMAIWRPLADQGDPLAQCNLGMLYANGKGARRDDAASTMWFQRSADQGQPAAETMMGFLYEEGHGVPKDLQTAILWFRKAATQGEAVAKENLRRLYDEHPDFGDAASRQLPAPTAQTHSRSIDSPSADAPRVARYKPSDRPMLDCLINKQDNPSAPDCAASPSASPAPSVSSTLPESQPAYAPRLAQNNTSKTLDISLVKVEIDINIADPACRIYLDINNATANHLNELQFKLGPFNVDLRNFRAYSPYSYNTFAFSTCASAVAAISAPNSVNIERCDMEGMREGDCLRLVNFNSQVTAATASAADAAGTRTKQENEQTGREQCRCTVACDQKIKPMYNCTEGITTNRACASRENDALDACYQSCLRGGKSHMPWNGC